MSRDNTTLLDILRAARLILEFTGVTDKASFLKDRKTQSAILHQLLILGEATKRISEGFRSLHPEIPWKFVAGMRDKLIHEYDEVDMEEVWSTVKSDITRLISMLEPFAPHGSKQ